MSLMIQFVSVLIILEIVIIYFHSLPFVPGISLRVSFLADLTTICNGVPITTNLLLFGSEQLSEENDRIIFSHVESFIMNSGRFVV